MYQNETLQATCECHLLLEDHQSFLITFKAGCVIAGTSGKITKLQKNLIFLNTSHTN